MGAFIDLTGQKFGYLTVIKRAENKGTQTMWSCQCECGNVITVNAYNLKSGHTRSCGCKKGTIITTKKTKHGYSHTRLDNIYQQIKYRCYDTNCVSYNDYGGRGIVMCDEWLNDRTAFFNWAMTNGYKDGLTIDRINNNKGYSHDNCRWSTMKTQCNNRRSNHCVYYNGKKYTLKELSEKYNVDYDKLKQRINKLHWNIEKAINTP